MYKRNWLIRYDINGFKMITLVNGTEEEMLEYMRSEIGSNFSYVGATDTDVVCGKKLGIPVYFAPEIKH